MQRKVCRCLLFLTHTFPDLIRQEDIHAKYESGVLRLSIPKQEEKKAQIEDKKYIAIEG